VLVCEEPPLLADDELEVFVDALLDPSCPDVTEEPVDVPVWAESPDPDWPEVDDPVLEVVADDEPDPDGFVVEAPVCVLVLLEDGWLDVELPVVVVADDEPVFAVLLGEGVGVGVGQGVGVGVGVGVGLVVVLVFELDVPDDGCALDDPPAEDEEELPVEAFADEPPAVVEVDPVVLVEALAEPPEDWLVGAGDCGVVVLEPVVVCVEDAVGVGVAVGEVGDVFQFVVKVVVVPPFVFDPERETGDVTVVVGVGVGAGVGVVLADVLDVLWVLDVPPLTDGSTLIMGSTLITGWTVIDALFVALCMMAWPPRA
jgi:hypothetical protein